MSLSRLLSDADIEDELRDSADKFLFERSFTVKKRINNCINMSFSMCDIMVSVPK